MSRFAETVGLLCVVVSTAVYGLGVGVIAKSAGSIAMLGAILAPVILAGIVVRHQDDDG